MKTFDLLSMCVRNLLRRKLRTVLTAIGVMIGSCAIIITISLGLGMTKMQNDALAQMGDLTRIDIYNYGGFGGGSGMGGEPPVLDDKAIREISKLPGVDVVSPIKEEYNAIEIWSGDRFQYSSSVIGIYPEAMEKLGYSAAKGTLLTEGGGRKIPILFGSNAAYQFANVKRQWARVRPYPDANGKIPDPYVDPMKDEFTIRLYRSDEEKMKLVEYEVQVTGVMNEPTNGDYQAVYSIYMPMEELNRLVAEQKRLNKIKESNADRNKGYEQAVVKCTDIKYVESVESYISDTMKFNTNSLESIRKPIQQQIQSTTLILGGLGLISLVVAAIGIANTMVMSIYERTREIGIMKVLGCEVPHIRAMFLTEAGIIGLIGGIVGIVVSLGMSWCMNNWSMIKAALGIVSEGGGDSGMGGIFGGIGGMMGGGGEISLIPPWLIALALVFGIFIGVVSGFIPANRAVQVSALEAIKHE